MIASIDNTHGALVVAVAATAAVLLAAAMRGRRIAARAREEATASQALLATRNAELQTLHAIGREVLSTLDAERIFGIIERECRKVFDVAFFFVGVLDPETHEIGISYRSLSDDALRMTLRPLGDDLASWIVREKRPLRVDDAAAGEGALPFRPHVVDGHIRSILAVPLLVGEKVIGVLSVQSRRPSAYDDHQLSLLATIAQQAAVAVENARQHGAATVDPLTRLPLRDGFLRRVEEESVRAKRYARAFTILMVDLDAFHEINDRSGRLAGDRFLRDAASIVRSRLRGADVACRYGGDEFCILLPETDLAGARAVAERLRVDLARLVVDVQGLALRTTASIGMASYPQHDAGEVKSLLLRADSALYQAKRAGRDRVVSFSV